MLAQEGVSYGIVNLFNHQINTPETRLFFMTTKLETRLYKLRHIDMIGDIFEEHCCLLSKEVLDNVFARDFLKMKEIPFFDKGKHYKRQYEWVFRGDVVKLLIGVQGEYGIVGAMVYINYSRLRYEPYVAIVNRSDVFENVDEVADMVGRALNWVYKGAGIVLYLEPWIPAEREMIEWGRDCNEAHNLAMLNGKMHIDENLDLETCVKRIIKKHTKKRGGSPPKVENTKKKKFVSALYDKKKLEKVVALINELMEGAIETQDKIMPFRAAIVAGISRRATWAEVQEGFGLDDKYFSSYYRLTRTDNTTYSEYPGFMEIVARFKAL